MHASSEFQYLRVSENRYVYIGFSRFSRSMHLFSQATCSNANDRTNEHLAMPLIIEHVDTTRAHAYLDTAISI